VWAADYGCFLVYETLDCSGELRVFQKLGQALKKACPGDGFNGRVVHPALQRFTCVSLPVHLPVLGVKTRKC